METISEPVREMLAADSSLAGFGIEVLCAENGRAVLRMAVGESFANGHRIAHGGMIFTLADTAFACAINSQAPGTATADASIVYFSPAYVGEELVAEGRVRRLAGRQSLVDVVVRSGDRVVAEYRGRGMVLRTSSARKGAR